jgi:arylsulfatase A-like enzyme
LRDLISMAESKRITRTLLAGLLGGAWAGAVVGLAEAGLLTATAGQTEEYWLFPYAVVSYGALGMLLAIGCTSIAAAVAPERTRHNAFGLCGAVALFALGGAVARYQVIQRVFHEDLVTFSFAGLAVHLALFVSVGGLALAVMRAGRRVQRDRGGVLIAAIGLIFCLGGSVAVAALASPRAPEETATGWSRRGATSSAPNIILIIADTLRADAVGSYGAEPGATPALDRFAAEAVRFENTYAQSSWTRPSIATILTSLYPSVHGAMHKMDALPDRVTTVAEALHAKGYWTTGFVSNINVAPIFNYQQGFDEYTYLPPTFYFWATDSAAQLAIYKGLRVVHERFFGDRIYVYNYYQDAAVVTEAVSGWLRRRPPSPFFLLIHYMDPHDPYFEVPYNGRGVARVATPNPPASRKNELHTLYGEDVGYLDDNLGALFATLKSLGLYDSSIIAVTADHGEEFQDHGGWWHGTTLYEEVLRVPLIVKRAHEERAGQVESRAARTLDIAPTLLAAAGLAPSPDFTGRDLFGPMAVTPEPLFAEEDLEGNVLTALQLGPWKIITANPENPRGLRPVELYNVAEDPQEHHDLTGTEPARTQEMLQSLAQERARISGRRSLSGLSSLHDAADHRS